MSRHHTCRAVPGHALDAGCSAQVAREAGCESLVLTHFSQRYPKVPVLGDVCHGRAGIAFDLMTVDLDRLDLPAAALPALRELLADPPDVLAAA
jgi:hypothetical protein